MKTYQIIPRTVRLNGYLWDGQCVSACAQQIDFKKMNMALYNLVLFLGILLTADAVGRLVGWTQKFDNRNYSLRILVLRAYLDELLTHGIR